MSAEQQNFQPLYNQVENTRFAQQLLFEPKIEGQIKQDYLSPLNQRSPSSRSYGRRSSTPIYRGTTPPRGSSMIEGRGTPKPPTKSMFDDDVGYQGKQSMAPPQETAMDVQNQGSQIVEQFPSILQVASNDIYDDTWVQVVGFQRQDLPNVLQELYKYGQIQMHGDFGDGLFCNWIYVKFKTQLSAQQVLQRGLMQIKPSTRISIHRLSQVQRDRIQQYLNEQNQAEQNMNMQPDQEIQPQSNKSFYNQENISPSGQSVFRSSQQPNKLQPQIIQQTGANWLSSWWN